MCHDTIKWNSHEDRIANLTILCELLVVRRLLYLLANTDEGIIIRGTQTCRWHIRDVSYIIALCNWHESSQICGHKPEHTLLCVVLFCLVPPTYTTKKKKTWRWVHWNPNCFVQQFHECQFHVVRLSTITVAVDADDWRIELLTYGRSVAICDKDRNSRGQLLYFWWWCSMESLIEIPFRFACNLYSSIITLSPTVVNSGSVSVLLHLCFGENHELFVTR